MEEIDLTDVIELHKRTFDKIIDIVDKSLTDRETKLTALESIESDAKKIIEELGGTY